MSVLTPEQDEFLRTQRLAVLGTGRRDGSPQLSTIYYDYDGSDILISVTSDRWKWKNAVRQPRVALLVNDGRKQLIVYGRAEGIEDDAGIVAGHRRLRARAGREAPSDDATFLEELRADHRVVLRITPERAMGND
ncbi:MAG: TIGR03618 family F420-dependent PPOX class oxidoreductase [Dehalococcoidia bacterium]|nr:TIGR03618 family F420-dependent PPOX class oxidoreductase [Dehalococcoidia bacterium]